MRVAFPWSQLLAIHALERVHRRLRPDRHRKLVGRVDAVHSRGWLFEPWVMVHPKALATASVFCNCAHQASLARFGFPQRARDENDRLGEHELARVKMMHYVTMVAVTILYCVTGEASSARTAVGDPLAEAGIAAAVEKERLVPAASSLFRQCWWGCGTDLVRATCALSAMPTSRTVAR